MAEEQTPTATVDETTVRMLNTSDGCVTSLTVSQTTAPEPTSEATDSAPAASNGAECKKWRSLCNMDTR